MEPCLLLKISPPESGGGGGWVGGGGGEGDGGLEPGTARSNLHSYWGLSFMKEKNF